MTDCLACERPFTDDRPMVWAELCKACVDLLAEGVDPLTRKER